MATAARPAEPVRASAPGRVNLVGDHTDHTGGLVLPLALELRTTVVGERGGDAVELTSADEPGTVRVPLDGGDPATVVPAWGRYVAGVVAELRPATGLLGRVTTDLPIGAGLSSSAALEVAVALALGFEGSERELALLAQRAEQQASGVPCGVMDQLAAAAGVADAALLIDCATLDVEPVPMPADAVVVVVHSGEGRRLAGSAYAEVRAGCEAAARAIGSLRTATDRDVAALADPRVRRHARHVVTENRRVVAVADALRRGDLATAGALLVESHASLRDDLGVSTPALDATVEDLLTVPGVRGARLTGAGFGGCVVGLADAGTDLGELGGRWHRVARAGPGAWRFTRGAQ